MNLHMNGPITQTVAVGVIAVVALFRTPEELSEALKTKPTSLTEVAESQPESAVLSHDGYGGEDIYLEVPFDLKCIPADKTRSLLALSDCIDSLSAFIRDQTETSSAVLSRASYTEGPLVPKVEEARRALAEICRIKWSTNTLTSASDLQACNHSL